MVGAGALARPDGAAIAALAAQGWRSSSARSRTAGTASRCCTPRPRASARSISASCRARAARRARRWRRAALDVLFLLGADEIDVAPRRVRRLYRHAWRPRRASRRRHPAGRGLSGKIRHLRQHRRPRADGGRAPRSRRARRARTGRSCARCPTCSAHKLPYDSLAHCARRCSRRIRICSGIDADRAGRPATICASSRKRGGHARQGAVRARRSTTSISPIRSRARRRSWPNARRWRTRAAGRRRSRGMTITSTSSGPMLWPLIVIVAQRVLLLVVLLIVIAYVLYADRKIWAAVQMRRGPNVVGPWGLLQSFADLLKFVLQGADHPGRRQQGRLPAGAAGHLRAGARGLGGDPGQRRLGDRRHQCRHPLHLRDLLARGLRHHHGRLGVELEISVPRRAALGRADGVLRSLDRLRHHHRAALRRLAQSHRHRRGAGRQLRRCSNWYWLPLFPMFVIFFISALAETNRPPFDLVEAESELVAGFMVEYGSTPYLLFMLGEYVAIVTMCAMATILFLGGWLPPFPCRAVHLGAGRHLVRRSRCCSCSSCSPW